MACSGKGPDLTGFSGRAGRVLSLVSLLGLWWGAARLAGDPGRLPGPGAVARFAWHAFIAGEMVPAMLATLARVAAAFVLSMLAGAAIGMLAGRSRQADALIDPWLVIALNLPVLMVVVLVYIWMGLTEAVREGARALDPALDELAQCFAIPRRRRWLKILLPQMAPYLAAAARAGLSVTWKIVLIVELIGRPNGVGFELNLFFQNFDVAGIVAYGLAFSLVMLAAETFLLQRLERRANAWR
jgi:NitT/TauT family transport system permease protein